jgi:hypothetical protein
MKTKPSCILLLQGLYFILTGIWGLVDIESFMLVTGPKTDIWLVKTFSGLVLALGLSFVLNSFMSGNTSTLITAALCAISLTIADTYYSLNGIISKIYLADGALELIFFILITMRLAYVKSELRKTDR